MANVMLDILDDFSSVEVLMSSFLPSDFKFLGLIGVNEY